MEEITPPISTTIEQLSSSDTSDSEASDDSASPSGESESGSDNDSDDERLLSRMNEALGKAKATARAQSGAGLKDSLENQDEVVMFGEEDDQAVGGKKREKLLDVKGKGKAKEESSLDNLAGDKWGRAPMKSLSKKERKDRHPRTAGPQWFNLPAPTMTPELKRELQAMRMRNSLDPKRFYRGGAKGEKLPEYFSLGHVVEANTRATTLTPSIARKRTFVEELVEDDQARAYTKRKTAEVMARGMSGRQRQKKGAKQEKKRKTV